MTPRRCLLIALATSLFLASAAALVLTVAEWLRDSTYDRPTYTPKSPDRRIDP